MIPVLLGVIVIVGASRFSEPIELTDSMPYAAMIGREYRVVSDRVNAYGIYGDWPERTLTEMTLVPGVGISGYEVAFRASIPLGAVVRIVSAWRDPAYFVGARAYYVVTIGETDLRQEVPIKVELSYGNEGVEADLNPAVYQRVVTGR